MPTYQEAQRRHAEHYQIVLSRVNDLFNRGGHSVQDSLELFDKEWENVRAAQAWAAANKEWDQAAALFTSNIADYGALLLPLRLRPDERRRWREEALSASRLIGNKRAESAHLINLANICDSIGQHALAVNFYEEALTIKRELNDREGQSRALDNLGIAYLNLGQPERALECLNQAIAVFPEHITIDDTVWAHCKGHVLGTMGQIYLRIGDYSRAVEYLEFSLHFARGSGARPEQATLLLSLGTAATLLSNHRHAIDLYIEALTIYRDLGMSENEKTVLRLLAQSYIAVGDPRRATEAFSTASSDREQASELSQELTSLGLAYDASGDIEKAVEFHQRALDIARRTTDRSAEGQALGNLGIAFKNSGRPELAIKTIEQALLIFREIGDRTEEGKALGNLGVAHKRLGNISAAVEFFRAQATIAREVGDEHSLSSATLNMGNIAATCGQFREAVALYNEALVGVQKTGDCKSQGMVLMNMGQAYFMLGGQEKAFQSLQQAKAIFEELRVPFPATVDALHELLQSRLSPKHWKRKPRLTLHNFLKRLRDLAH